LKLQTRARHSESNEQFGTGRCPCQSPTLHPKSSAQSSALAASYYKSGAWRTHNISHTAADQHTTTNMMSLKVQKNELFPSSKILNKTQNLQFTVALCLVAAIAEAGYVAHAPAADYYVRYNFNINYLYSYKYYFLNSMLFSMISIINILLDQFTNKKKCQFKCFQALM
jgi:hypothetical protein